MARQSGDLQAGFLTCLACHGSRLVVMRSEEDEGPPPSVAVDVECVDCEHTMTVDVSQATEQVSLGFFLVACPDRCTEKEEHAKR
jgi:hypothetical protein